MSRSRRDEGCAGEGEGGGGDLHDESGRLLVFRTIVGCFQSIVGRVEMVMMLSSRFEKLCGRRKVEMYSRVKVVVEMNVNDEAFSEKERQRRRKPVTFASQAGDLLLPD